MFLFSMCAIYRTLSDFYSFCHLAESVLTSGAGSFFIKTYTILISIAELFSHLNTFRDIMTLQERNEVNNYERYKFSEKI